MISAVIHTYNEEKNIVRCLSSLKWVDEIVLIDMGSTDNTVARAKEFQSKILKHPYIGFVEPARNFGISKATGDWIIIVDADEEIPPRLAAYLKEQSKSTETDYFRIARRNYLFGKWMKHTGWWPDYQVRFFRKGSVEWVEKIHGVPLTKGTGSEIEADEKHSIAHYNYQSIEQFITRLNRYTGISAKELHIQNRKATVRSILEAPLSEFIKRFFAQQGYKDGVHGLALSSLQSFYELIVQLKLWELNEYHPRDISLAEIESYISKEKREKDYWVANELLKQEHSLTQDIVWKVKRRRGSHG